MFVSNVLVHGDDVVIVSNTKIDLTKLTPHFAHLGMEVKVEVSHYFSSNEDKVHFLGSL